MRSGRRVDSQRRYRETWARWRETTDEAFADAVRRCHFASDVLRVLGFDLSGGNFVAVRRRLARLSLDTSHWFKGRPPRGRPLLELTSPGSSGSRGYIKRRLLKAGVLRNECYECGQQPIWRGKPLVLVLDHINGVNDDYTPENLRLLCPNCNSQTPTFCGRNMKKRRRDRVRERPPIYVVANLAFTYRDTRRAPVSSAYAFLSAPM